MTKGIYPRSLEDLGELSPAEQRVLEGACAGQTVTLGDGERPAKPSAECTIRAGLIRLLLLGGCDGHRTHEKGVQIAGAFISDQLILEWCRFSAPLALLKCWIGQKIESANATLSALALSGSVVSGANLQGVTVKGDVFLRNGFRATGQVRLAGAMLDGQLNCSDGRFEYADGSPLSADGINVKGSVFLNGRFCATGQVRLSRAQIGGQLACDGGRFENADGIALNAQGAIVKDGVFLRGGFHSVGQVHLTGAEIDGQLDCSDGCFENTGGYALSAESVHVNGNVFLKGGFRAKGEVRFLGAKIRGQISCENGQFENAGGSALNLQNANISGDVFLRNRFHATGEVCLSEAEIGGQLACDGGRFRNANGSALNAQDAQVTSGFFWRQVRVDAGRVDLMRAHVGVLVDDPQSWPGEGRLYLDGFRYDAILGSDVAAEGRLEWLAKNQRPGQEFQPQPYEQLASVLGSMGSLRNCSLVLVEREKLAHRLSQSKRLTELRDTAPRAIKKVEILI